MNQDADAHRRDNPELRQLNLGYPRSELSRELRRTPGRVRAGDRAPDAPGRDHAGRELRMFDLIHGGRTTLLAFGSAAERIAVDLAAAAPQDLRAVAVLEQAGPTGATAFVDVDDHARRGYDIPGGDVLLVIRPDGYLGLALDAGPAAAPQAREYLAGLCAGSRCGVSAWAS
jgi:hypothetical protein